LNNQTPKINPVSQTASSGISLQPDAVISRRETRHLSNPVGDEIVLGQIEDTNATWLSRELQRIGAMPGERRAVADDRAALARTLRELSATHAAIVMTGGLGPTLDDLTRESLGDVVDPGAALVRAPQVLQRLRVHAEDARLGAAVGLALCPALA
jgi:hypothetical protein